MDFLEARVPAAPSHTGFLAVMEHVHGKTLVDVGCGSGTYGPLVQRYFPHIEYEGFDIREDVIEGNSEMWPALKYFVADALVFDYSPYDIVLVSGVLGEGYTGMPKASWPILVARLAGTVHGDLVVHRISDGQESHILSLFEEGGFFVAYRQERGKTQRTYIFNNRRDVSRENECHL